MPLHERLAGRRKVIIEQGPEAPLHLGRDELHLGAVCRRARLGLTVRLRLRAGPRRRTEVRALIKP